MTEQQQHQATGQVDLDDLQRHLDADHTLDDAPQYEMVRRAVAELRAARRLHRAVQLWRDGEDLDQDAIEAEMLDALAAYDKAIGGPL